ncbi:MAG: DUF4040 domain-containing protein [Lachnospiraceae bacterium]|nr:DUF4040 domain-containing protein [Lachnospiraceae bacterium]
MTVFKIILLAFLVLCAIAASFSKNLLNSVLIFMAYSLIMSVIWMLLESPDLAITEAAVGAGITSVLFFVTLNRIHSMFKNASDSDKNKKETPKEITENEQ